MGIWVLEGEMDGSREGAALVDSVTMRPLWLPVFDGVEAAEDFLAFSRREGVRDLRTLGPQEADALHTRWLEAPKADCRACRVPMVVLNESRECCGCSGDRP